MYKNATKNAQRVLERTGARIDSLTPNIGDPNQKRKSKLKIKVFPKVKKHKRKFIACSICSEEVQRSISTIKKHFLKNHKQQLTDAEAFRIASSKDKESRYVEDFVKSPLEVSGGLPSLGKRR